MTEIATLLAYFGKFATAYPSDNVPTDAEYPYITVEPRLAFFGDGDVPIQLNLWARTDSDAAVNKIVRAIGEDIGYGGMPRPCDGGWLWIKRGTPLVVPVTVPDDEAIKRRLINVSVEFMTY